ncbi:hypothetical protein NHX12_033225 [Muraenolepis orangiensis]|uniref:Hcy-binding domain-containing protein n=1 Tax=Muraenolepis orangiensis TaxID=630683 RepID=A0A9Q0IG42_9TELE|nr:hypothetical protein NHX12_033225 [Muraenolepis orangiensis]
MESVASLRGAGALILDGGLATDLEAQGLKLQGDPLWSARLLHSNPQAIRDAHYRFLVSGADVVSTATYQASVNGFVKHLDMSWESAQELMMSGVHLAQEAVQRFVSSNKDTGRGRPLVAGSVGAFGAFLLDGSEYSGAYAEKMSIEELKSWHRPQVGCLVSAGADLVAFETIPSVKEAEALLELLREFPSCRAWLSFSCKDGRSLCDGSLFLEAVRMAHRSSQLVAVGVNCCSPALVKPLLESVSQLRSPALPWVVYPNSGEQWDTLSGWKASGAKVPSVAELSQEWIKQGAAMIGGCCRISPAHIAELRKVLRGNSTSAE